MPLNRIVQKATDPNYGATIPSSVNLSTMPISGTVAQFNAALSDNDFATVSGNEVLTNKIINNSIQNYSTFRSPKELVVVDRTAPTGTINYDILSQSAVYYTTNAAANFIVNFRGNSTTTLNSVLNSGEMLTVVLMNTNGAVAYFTGGAATLPLIDGTSTGVTMRWSGGSAPTSGNANAVDIYTFSILKTSVVPEYTIFASVGRF